jgi:hypothetical protein
MKGTNYEAPRYVIFSIFLLHPPSYVANTLLNTLFFNSVRYSIIPRVL